MPRRALAQQPPTHRLVAALDLGSNSFHMVIAQVVDGGLLTVTKVKRRVRLAAGLDSERQLDAAAMQRGWQALKVMRSMLQSVAPQAVRVVATHTLRQAKNAAEFLQQAERILQVPIEVIAGKEEARLIYAGIAHTHASRNNRLVIDIGGGSTEFIIGKQFQPRLLDSLMMGCVAFEREFFDGGGISAARFAACETRCHLELQRIAAAFRREGWRIALGSSGTIQAIAEVLAGKGYDDGRITRGRLRQLRNELIQCGHASLLHYEGLSDERRAIFAPGLAILLSCFEQLEIEEMQVTDAALREGVLHELVGRFTDLDVRERSVYGLLHRFHVDIAHAERVQQTVLKMHGQVAKLWQLNNPEWRALLGWATLLEEIGLAVSYVQMHKHGEYLLRQSDLDGFAQTEKLAMAIMVRNQKRKFVNELYLELPTKWQKPLRRMTVLLRLAALLHHARSSERTPGFSLQVSANRIALKLPKRWLQQHELVQAELKLEQGFLRAAGFTLVLHH